MSKTILTLEVQETQQYFRNTFLFSFNVRTKTFTNFLGRCQYQNKKALFTDPIFSEGFEAKDLWLQRSLDRHTRWQLFRPNNLTRFKSGPRSGHDLGPDLNPSLDPVLDPILDPETQNKKSGRIKGYLLTFFFLVSTLRRCPLGKLMGLWDRHSVAAFSSSKTTKPKLGTDFWLSGRFLDWATPLVLMRTSTT